MNLQKIIDGGISEEDREVIQSHADCRQENGISVGYCEDYGKPRCIYTCDYAHERRTLKGRVKHYLGLRFMI